MRIAFWPVLLVLVGSWLAGCLDDEPVVDDVVAPPAEPPVVRVPVDVRGSPSSDTCGGGLFCFAGRDASVSLDENRTLTGLDLVLTWDELVQEPPKVRLSATCSEDGRACSLGTIATAEGRPPLRLNATGLDAPRGIDVHFQVEVIDPRPEALFEQYHLQGFLIAIDHAPDAARTCYDDGHEGHEHAKSECPCPTEHEDDPGSGQNETGNETHNGTHNGTEGNGTAPDGERCAQREDDERDPGLRRRVMGRDELPV